jgi:hypothetical protein
MKLCAAIYDAALPYRLVQSSSLSALMYSCDHRSKTTAP